MTDHVNDSTTPAELGRAERALRAVLAEIVPVPAPDPRAVRAVARRRRTERTAVRSGLLVTALVVVALVGGSRLAGLTGGQGAALEAQPAGQTGPPPPVDPAPAGWRTEYFRDIAFEVPSTWGYAMPPDATWCSGQRNGEPLPEQRKPYVWHNVDRAFAAIACPPMPETLMTEHLEVTAPGPATDYREGVSRVGAWLVATRFQGGAVLILTTQDQSLADRILDSARVLGDNAPCPPASPVAGPLGARPDPGTALGELQRADWIMVCQYEPVLSPEDRTLPRLRTGRLRSDGEAQTLLDRLKAAPENLSRCATRPYQDIPDVAVLLRIAADGIERDVYISAGGCADGTGSVGGIDDGRTVRVLDRSACQAVLKEPIALFGANGDIGRACLG